VSALEQALTDYLQLRHSLGHELAEAGWLLPGLVAYLDAHRLPTVTIEAALAWAQQAPKSPTGRVTTVGPRRMTAARGFARYLSGIDAGTEVPPLGLIAGRRRASNSAGQGRGRILGTQRQPRQDDQKTDLAASTPTCSANASCSPSGQTLAAATGATIASALSELADHGDAVRLPKSIMIKR
jgi:hypothetical protein